MLEAPTALTSDTRFADILGAGVQAGDTISISGTNHDGDQVSGTFTISNTNLKISNLLSSIEQTFGNQVTASVDASGRISLADDQAGSSDLSMSLQANNEGGSSLGLGTMTSPHREATLVPLSCRRGKTPCSRSTASHSAALPIPLPTRSRGLLST